jgi:hypothetical protein
MKPKKNTNTTKITSSQTERQRAVVSEASCRAELLEHSPHSPPTGWSVAEETTRGGVRTSCMPDAPGSDDQTARGRHTSGSRPVPTSPSDPSRINDQWEPRPASKCVRAACSGSLQPGPAAQLPRGALGGGGVIRLSPAISFKSYPLHPSFTEFSTRFSHLYLISLQQRSLNLVLYTLNPILEMYFILNFCTYVFIIPQTLWTYFIFI